MKGMRKGLFKKAIDSSMKEAAQSEVEIKTGLCEPYRTIVKIMSVCCALYVIISGLIGTIYPYLHRALFLGFILPIVFIKYPANRKNKNKTKPTIWDIALSIASIVCVCVIAFDIQRILWRVPFLDKVLPKDMIVGCILIFCVIAACRRIIGWALVILTGLFLAYGLWGSNLPGMLAHGGVTFRRLIEYLILMSDGLFSSTAGIGATYVFTFVSFGVLLTKTRLGDAIFNIAKIITNNSLGAPAKIAVISSAFMAMISGSAVANVVTTGSITIPLMKKVGLRPHEAAAVEIASSVGGQITPPIMGSGIFIMAELTGTPLAKLLALSILPAILYYIIVYVYVDDHIHIRADAGEIRQETEALPKLKDELKDSILYFFPIIVLCVMMFRNFSAYFASSIAILVLLATTFVKKETRPSFKTLADWFESMTMGAITTATIISCAALVVGVVFLTGFVVTASSAIVRLANGNLILVTLLAMLMCVVLGTSLPITVSYLIISILGVPAFTKLGVPLLSAHIAIFWFSQVATITPPVCTTSFLAADIAGAPRFKTGFTGLKFAKGMLIIPFLIIFNDLIVGSVPQMLAVAACMAVGLVALCWSFDGYMNGHIGWIKRAVLFIASVAMFYASTFKLTAGRGVPFYAVGLVLFVIMCIMQFGKKKGMKANEG